MTCQPHRSRSSAPLGAAAVHDRAVSLIAGHITAQGAPEALADLVAGHLEPILVEVSRDRAAPPVVLLEADGRTLTIRRFTTMARAERFAERHEERGRWFAGVNLGQLLVLAAMQLREAAHQERQSHA